MSLTTRFDARFRVISGLFGALALTLALVSASSASAAEVADASGSDADALWPQWRGPNRNGIAASGAWPDSLSEEHLTPKWRTELAPGYSGPVVGADKIFIVETRDDKEEVVRALDRETGEPLWEVKWDVTFDVPAMGRGQGDWAKATPAYDGTHLFVAGMQGFLKCIDAESGEIVWEINPFDHYGHARPQWGYDSSPIVRGDHVYVQGGRRFLKIATATGEIEWGVLEFGGDPGWQSIASPQLVEITGAEQFVVHMPGLLAGVDPESGATYWTQETPAYQSIAYLDPLVIGDSLFVSIYGKRSHRFNIAPAGEAYEVTEAWSTKAKGNMASPVVIDGYVYMLLNNRRMACLDFATGEEKWRTRESFGRYWSMVAGDGKILALDEAGELLLIRANPEEYDLLDRRSFADSSTWAYLAVVGDEVYVRDLQGLTRFEWK